MKKVKALFGNIKLTQPVEVIWLDAHSQASWTLHREFNEQPPPYIHTCGYWLGVEKHGKCVMIAESVHLDDLSQIGAPIKIPLGMLQSVKVLGPPRRKV